MTEQKQRVYSLDLARGLAVVFMIFIHTLDTYSISTVKHSLGGWFIGFFGGPPGAPVFMALMGASSYYSRHTDLSSGVRRGIRIILLGYLLNLLRNTLPALWAAHFAPASVPAAMFNYLELFLELDILQFAGLSLIAMAFIRKYQVNRYVLLALAAAVALASPCLWGTGTNIPGIGRVLDFLWGNRPSTEDCLGNLVSFPFFPWFSYVLLGMFIGDTLTRSNNTDVTFRRFGLAGLLVIAIMLPLLLPRFLYHLGDYYHSRPGIILLHSGFVLFWLWLCQMAVSKIPMNGVFRLLFGWSRDVNRIYMIQWVLLMRGAMLFGAFDKAGWGQTLAWIGAIAAGTHVINALWARFLTEKRRERTNGLRPVPQAHGWRGEGP